MWGNVPQRNKYFTGRLTLLEEIRHRIVDEEVAALLPHALQGMGGVGKTQLAIEYAHRYQADYDVVWWIPAEQVPLARAALAALAPRLGLTGVAALGRIEDAVAAVLDALRRGEPYQRWLLIFDNADQPETIRDLMAPGPGHVLVTSRNHRWESFADTVEVDVFTRAESLEFLHRRVPHISGTEATQLAEELGDLPLALEQAAALLAETVMPVATYLELLEQQAGKILGENRPADYPVPVAAAWGLAMARVRDETPHAMALLRRCAFFGSEPVSVKLFERGHYVLDSPLGDALGDPVLINRAVRALGRYALARIDNYHQTLQVHRIIQKLVRDELDAEEATKIRYEVHLLLGAAAPGDPDDFDNWPRYADLLAHVGPSGVVESQEPAVRRFVGNMVRYLYAAGDYRAALAYAEQALGRWIADSGEDHPDVLVMSRHIGNVLWARGDYTAAHELRHQTLERMRAVLGEDHEETLILINAHGADLRASGRFTDARELDESSVQRHRQVFGDEHPRTFWAANNLATDYQLTCQYIKALALQEQNYRDRLDFYGRDDHPQVLFALHKLARIRRHAGHHALAWEMEERAYSAFREAVRQGVLPTDHPLVLEQAKSLSIARRKVGEVAQALELAQDVHHRFVRAYGADHADTLATVISLANTKRVAGDLAAAEILIDDAVQPYRKALGADHPWAKGILLNLAVIRRRLGDPQDAKALLDEALPGLEGGIGRDHVYTLACAANLASVLADLGDHDGARELSQDTHDRFLALLGENHPATLACARNLALDLRAVGREREAEELAAATQDRYLTILGETYPDLKVATDQRLDFDFDPPQL